LKSSSVKPYFDLRRFLPGARFHVLSLKSAKALFVVDSAAGDLLAHRFLAMLAALNIWALPSSAPPWG
jgi:hypothetical protein